MTSALLMFVGFVVGFACSMWIESAIRRERHNGPSRGGK